MLASPNTWSCLPTAICNVLDIHIDALTNLIGHDGSDKPYPYPWDQCYAGFSMQECIDALDMIGYTVSCILVNPLLQPNVLCPAREVLCPYGCPKTRLKYYMDHNVGVLTGTLTESGVGHALAWTGGKVYDCRGKVTEHLVWDVLFNWFEPQAFYRIK